MKNPTTPSLTAQELKFIIHHKKIYSWRFCAFPKRPNCLSMRHKWACTHKPSQILWLSFWQQCHNYYRPHSLTVDFAASTDCESECESECERAIVKTTPSVVRWLYSVTARCVNVSRASRRLTKAARVATWCRVTCAGIFVPPSPTLFGDSALQRMCLLLRGNKYSLWILLQLNKQEEEQHKK